jgi:hypothetical protein
LDHGRSLLASGQTDRFAQRVKYRGARVNAKGFVLTVDAERQVDSSEGSGADRLALVAGVTAGAVSEIIVLPAAPAINQRRFKPEEFRQFVLSSMNGLRLKL